MPSGAAPPASSIPRAISALKGRDLRALQAFRERVKGALGKALVQVVYLARRPLDVPAELCAPPPEPSPAPTPGAPGRGMSLAIRPAPEPPGELRAVVRVERRDAFVEERVDQAALEVALETGALILPLVLALEDESMPGFAAGTLAAALPRGDAL